MTLLGQSPYHFVALQLIVRRAPTLEEMHPTIHSRQRKGLCDITCNGSLLLTRYQLAPKLLQGDSVDHIRFQGVHHRNIFRT